MSKYSRILKASQSAAIVAVIENLSIDQNGFFLDATQMDNVESALEAGESAIANVTTLNEQLSQANTARQTAEESLATANSTISTQNTRISELQTQLTAAQEKPAGEFQASTRERDDQGSGKKPFHESESNPANQLADNLFGKPKAKQQ
jgi:hypothetical protein